MRERRGRIAGSARQAMRMLARRGARAAAGRNRILFFAVLFCTAALAVIFAFSTGRLEAERIRSVRQAGTAASTCLEGADISQYESIRSLSYIRAVGRKAPAGRAVSPKGEEPEGEEPKGEGYVCRLSALDETAWEVMVSPAYTGIEGHYPAEEQEIMLPVRALEDLGISRPREGMEISLEVETGLFEKRRETFLLSGWYTDYTAGSGQEAQGYISEEKLEEWGGSLEEELELLILQRDTLGGQQTEERLYRDVGLETEDQRFTGGNTASYEAVRRLAGGYGAAALAAAVILTGMFFLIYNVMQISMAGDVRQMGLLHILGMTDGQLRDFYLGQLKGPILGGVLGGTALSALLLLTWVPTTLGERYLGDWGGAESAAFFRPGILAACAVFALLSAGGAALPAILRVIRLSGPEASAYTGGRPGERRKRRAAAGKKKRRRPCSPGRELVFMAWQNVTRHRARFLLTVLSLFLGMEAALGALVVARGADYRGAVAQRPDFVVAGSSCYPAEEGEGDLGGDLERDPFLTGKDGFSLLYDNDYDEFSPISQEVKEQLLAAEGVDQSSVKLVEGGYLSPTFSRKGLEPLNDTDDSVKELEEEYGSSGLPVEVMLGADYCTVQILSEGEIRELTAFAREHDLEVDLESLAAGTGVFLLHDHILSPAKERLAGESVGEPITFSTLWTKEERERRMEATQEELEQMGEVERKTSRPLTLCGYMDTKAEGFPDFPRSWHGENILYFVISREGFDKLPTEAKTLLVELDAEDGREADVQKDVERITAAENRRRDEAGEAGVFFISAEDLLEEAGSYIFVSNLVFGVIAVLLIFAGLLNYFNVCVTGILSRRREFDMLERIGMTRRQLRWMLAAEGSFYVLAAAALLLTAGSAILAALGAFMGSRISWFAFHWPAGPAALMTAGLFVICLTVPFLACRRGR